MNKKFVPTAQQRENVEAMVGFGIPQDKICLLIKNQNTKKPIDGKTLRKYFPDEIATGETKANAQVAGSLFKDATSCPNDRARVAASSFWLKMRAGWKDTTVHELVGKDGGPIKPKMLSPSSLPNSTELPNASLVMRLALKPKMIREKILRKLKPEEREQLVYDWGYRARPSQQAPPGNWRTAGFSPAVALGKLASEPNGFVNKSTKANVALHWWRQLPLMFAML